MSVNKPPVETRVFVDPNVDRVIIHLLALESKKNAGNAEFIFSLDIASAGEFASRVETAVHMIHRRHETKILDTKQVKVIDVKLGAH